jgi:hypothetical protein
MSAHAANSPELAAIVARWQALPPAPESAVALAEAPTQGWFTTGEVLPLIKAAVAIGAARCQSSLTAVHNIIGGGGLNGHFLPLLEAEIGSRRTALADRSAWWKRIMPPRPPTGPTQPFRLVERRYHQRRLAMAGPMPPSLAANFTTGELAALKIIGDEVRDHGYCDLSKREIARRAQVVTTIVHRAQREAIALGLIAVQVRPVPGRKSLPSVIRIVRREWQAWLSKRPSRSEFQEKQGALPCARKPVESYKSKERSPATLAPLGKVFVREDTKEWALWCAHYRKRGAPNGIRVAPAAYNLREGRGNYFPGARPPID